MPLKIFEVTGPFEVPLKEGKKHRYIPIDCREFWRTHHRYKRRRGCYIFGFSASGGFRPVYVGKTKRDFGSEAFTAHKIAQHYTPALANTVKGTPVMFFIVAPQHGPPPKIMISDLEKFLIQAGVAKNPDLSNIQNRQESKWGIKGVVRGGQGNIRECERKFRIMMGLNK